MKIYIAINEVFQEIDVYGVFKCPLKALEAVKEFYEEYDEPYEVTLGRETIVKSDTMTTTIYEKEITE